MQKQFDITCIADTAFMDRIDVMPLEDLLNAKIDLADYSDKVLFIFFAFILLPPENTMHEEFVEYMEEEKMLRVGRRLDYETLKSANQKEIQKAMNITFLAAFKESLSFNHIDFNLVRFTSRIMTLL